MAWRGVFNNKKWFVYFWYDQCVFDAFLDGLLVGEWGCVESLPFSGRNGINVYDLMTVDIRAG